MLRMLTSALVTTLLATASAHAARLVCPDTDQVVTPFSHPALTVERTAHALAATFPTPDGPRTVRLVSNVEWASLGIIIPGPRLGQPLDCSVVVGLNDYDLPESGVLIDDRPPLGATIAPDAQTDANGNWTVLLDDPAAAHDPEHFEASPTPNWLKVEAPQNDGRIVITDTSSGLTQNENIQTWAFKCSSMGFQFRE